MFVPKRSRTVINNNYFHIDLRNHNLDYYYGAKMINAMATVFGIENSKVCVSAAPYNLIYSKTMVFKAPLITYNDSNIDITVYFLHLSLSQCIIRLESHNHYYNGIIK